MTRRLIRESDPPAGQLASPVPQYWNPNTEAFEDVLGAHGAPRAILYGPNGQPIGSSNPLPVADSALAQAVAQLATEGKLEEARALLETISQKDFATQTTLSEVLQRLEAIEEQLETGDAKVQLKGSDVELPVLLTNGRNDVDALPTRQPWDMVPTGWEQILSVSEDGFDQRIHEIGNMIYDVWDTSSRRYKLVYSGLDTKEGTYTEHIGFAVSSDGKNWTKVGHITTRRAEDPYMVYDGSKWHVFCEDKEGGVTNNIRHYTSTDFETWVDEGHALLNGPPGSWDATDVSSPLVWIEDNVWYMFYEGRASGNLGAIGLATSTDGYTWTKHPNNPIAIPNARYFGSMEPDVPHAVSLVPDDMIKVNGVYHMTVHAGLWGGGFVPYRLVSRDLLNWTPLPLDARFALPVVSDGTVMLCEIRGELHALVSRINHGLFVSKLANPNAPWLEQLTAQANIEAGPFATVGAGSFWTSPAIPIYAPFSLLIDSNRNVDIDALAEVHLGGTNPWTLNIPLASDVEATRTLTSGIAAVRPRYVPVPSDVRLPAGRVRFRVTNKDSNNPAEVRLWIVHEGRSRVGLATVRV